MIEGVISPKKLIEVALPLDAINAAAAAAKRKSPKAVIQLPFIRGGRNDRSRQPARSSSPS